MSADPALPELSDLEIVGPFDSHHVLLYGRRVPHLQATPLNGGIVHLTLDERYGLDLTMEEAERIVPFIADCIAVAAGYACHPRAGEDPCRLPLFPREFSVGQAMTD